MVVTVLLGKMMEKEEEKRKRKISLRKITPLSWNFWIAKRVTRFKKKQI